MMNMKIKVKKIVKEIKQSKSDRTKTSLYISKSIYKAFKRAVDKEDLSPSIVIEKLMSDFVGSTKGN